MIGAAHCPKHIQVTASCSFAASKTHSPSMDCGWPSYRSSVKFRGFASAGQRIDPVQGFGSCLFEPPCFGTQFVQSLPSAASVLDSAAICACV